MDDTRNRRIRVEHSQTLDKNLKLFDEAVAAIEPRVDGKPSLLDVALGIPAVRETVDSYPNKSTTVESFDFLKTALPIFDAKFEEDAKEYLRDVVRKQIDIDVSVDPLDLAVGNFFVCSLCGTYSVTYRGVLAHWCMPRRMHPSGDIEDQYLYKACRQLEGEKWSPRDFHIDLALMQHLIALLGLDPKTATIKEMNDLSVRLTCMKHNYKHQVWVKDWRTMVRK